MAASRSKMRRERDFMLLNFALIMFGDSIEAAGDLIGDLTSLLLLKLLTSILFLKVLAPASDEAAFRIELRL